MQQGDSRGKRKRQHSAWRRTDGAGSSRSDAAVSAVPAPKPPSFVLTTSCPDTTGVVAAVASFLAAHNCLITEAQHYDDPYTVTVVHAHGVS